MQRSPGLTLSAAAPVIALAFLVMTAAGCATLHVNSYAARGMDPARYHTYTWSPTDPETTGDPRLDSNQFFDTRVRAEVDDQLAARGFEKAPASGPDLLVRYHMSVRQKIDVPRIDPTDPQDHGEVGVYDAGTLLIDLVDPRTDQLIWRGWAEGSMEGEIDSQEAMERRIDRAVTKILDRLPRTQ